MNDLIGRQALIKDAESWTAVDEYEKHLKKNVIEWLKEFPSAQLGTNMAEVGTDCISRHAISAICNACGKIDCDKMDKCEKLQLSPANISETPNSSDTISRQQAIDDIWTVSPLARLDRKWVDRWLRQLPSAQPEPIRINLNEPIKVKLTDCGKEIYYHQYDRVNQIAGREICKPKFPKEDENGYTEFQLWCFMELYGEHTGMTLPNVIEPLEIVYER
jgi:hypothetical protein